MTENPAPGFVEYEISQRLVLRYEPGLLPQGVAGGGRNTADNDIAYFPLGVAAYDVYNFFRSHIPGIRCYGKLADFSTAPGRGE
jgi:hypothetical protein